MSITRSTAIVAALSGAALSTPAWADSVALAPGAQGASDAWLAAHPGAAQAGGATGVYAGAPTGVAEPTFSIISGSFLPAPGLGLSTPTLSTAGGPSGIAVLMHGAGTTAAGLASPGRGWYSVGHQSSQFIDAHAHGFGSLMDGPAPVVVPLPAGVWIGAAGLAGVGVLRTSRRR